MARHKVMTSKQDFLQSVDGASAKNRGIPCWGHTCMQPGSGGKNNDNDNNIDE